jgi:hypothetical protein
LTWRSGSESSAADRLNRASPSRTSHCAASSTLKGRFAGTKIASERESQTLIGRSGRDPADPDALMCFNASNLTGRRPPPAARAPVPSRRRATTPAPWAKLGLDGQKTATGTTGSGSRGQGEAKHG